MAHDRAALRKPVQERRPVVVASAARTATQASPAQRLQRQLGNEQAQRWLARAQLSSAVSSPHEPAEVEAHATARAIMRMPVPGDTAAVHSGSAAAVQRQAASTPMPASPVTDLRGHVTGGSPLPASARSFMAPRFGANFDHVRVHTDNKAAQLSQNLNAHAFTVGSHVFFGPGKFQPDTRDGKELIAHELTHTIQQGAVVQRSADTSVTQRSPPRVQRLGISDALEYFAGYAYNIPGFRMLTVVLGINPITMSTVDRSAVNILRALVEMVPGGAVIAQALESHGILPKVAAWVEGQVRAFGLAGSALKQALDRFLDSLSWRDIFDLGGVWERAKRIFTEPIGRLIALAQSLISQILGFIREAILLPLAALAEGTRGYDLLKAVLGQDPITGQPVARSPENLIGGFMKLIGQEEVWENLKKANAVARAWTWFQGALATVTGFVREIPGLIVRTLQSLQISDLLFIPNIFAKVVNVFAGFVGRFIAWATGAVFNLLEIIFEVVAPAAVPYLAKSKAAFRLIVANPIGFIRNLIAAIKGGINAFVANIWTHLKTGFINWLFGALTEAGIEIPEGLPSLPSILKLVANVLGLTMARLRAEAVKMLGPTAVAVIEKLVDYVKAFWEGGPAALWAKIKEDLGNLKTMALDAIQDWLVTTIVKQAVIKLVSLFNPVGAFIQAILAIYNTIQVVIERLGQIGAFIGAVINSVYDIATGAIGGAIKWIENALAGAIPLVLSFLAGLLGIGGLTKKVRETLEKVGNLVWDAIRKLIKKGIDLVKKLVGKIFGKDKKPDDRTDAQKQSDLDKAMGESEQLMRQPKITATKLRKEVVSIKKRYRLTTLEVVSEGKSGTKERLHIHGAINPERNTKPADFVAGMEEVRVQFNIRVQKFNAVAFRGQLRQQERGINSMKMDSWASNRGQFLATKEESDDGSGRSAESAADQSKFRTLMKASIVARRLEKKLSATRAEAEAFAENWMSTRAALHGPDQIAGGGRAPGSAGDISTDNVLDFKRQTGLVAMGSARINSSIGSQWKTRIKLIDDVVLGDKYPSEEKSKLNMNVHLDGVEI